MKTEHILILGGGISGLLAALLLAGEGRRVTVIERDPSPANDCQTAIFRDWRRTGVGQIRHTHAFRARFRHLLEQEAPELLVRLRAAGARHIPYSENLAPTLRPARDRPDPVDTVAMRRTLFESVLRAYLEEFPLVTLRFGAKAEALLLDERAGRQQAKGLRVDGQPIPADIVIDAGGRSSPVASWLRSAGIEFGDETHPCHLTYHTRFFELLPGAQEPAPPQGRTGDLGFLKFGVIPADNRSFSITLALPDTEKKLREHVSADAGFMALCRLLPAVAPFVDPAVARPLGRVGGMADLNSRWRSYRTAAGPLLPGLLGIGDALILANPLYGRGMTCAFVEARALRDALREASDFEDATATYEARVRDELYDYFADMRAQDLAARARAVALAGGARDAAAEPPPGGFANRLISAARAALPRSPTLMRGMLRSIHMLDMPGIWHKGWRARLAALNALLLGGEAPANDNPTRDEIYRSISPAQF